MDMEEWWGRIFEQRGKIKLELLPKRSKEYVPKLSTDDVAEIYRSEGYHDHPSAFGLLAGLELKRRANWTARAALALSVISILISLGGLILDQATK